MPVTIVEPKNRIDPTLGYSFAIQIKDEIKGWFTECTGLGVEREIKAQQEGGVNSYVHQLPGRLKHTNVSLKHGLAGNELWEWFHEGMYDGNVTRYNVSIILYDHQGKRKRSWDLHQAFPIKWTGPTFNSANNEVAVETLVLTHHGLKMNDWSNT